MYIKKITVGVQVKILLIKWENPRESVEGTE
jgi:hypothetical protein